MDNQIIPRAYFEKKGFMAALRGDAADSHGMNWNAAALPDWEKGHNACLIALPSLHLSSAVRSCDDAEQVAA